MSNFALLALPSSADANYFNASSRSRVSSLATEAPLEGEFRGPHSDLRQGRRGRAVKARASSGKLLQLRSRPVPSDLRQVVYRERKLSAKQVEYALLAAKLNKAKPQDLHDVLFSAPLPAVPGDKYFEAKSDETLARLIRSAEVGDDERNRSIAQSQKNIGAAVGAAAGTVIALAGMGTLLAIGNIASVAVISATMFATGSGAIVVIVSTSQIAENVDKEDLKEALEAFEKLAKIVQVAQPFMSFIF